MKRLRSNKPCDQFGLVAGFLQHAHVEALDALLSAYNHFVFSGTAPSTWQQSSCTIYDDTMVASTAICELATERGR